MDFALDQVELAHLLYHPSMSEEYQGPHLYGGGIPIDGEVSIHPKFQDVEAILITQCYVPDFIARLENTPPNLVHIMKEQAERLLGPNGMLLPFLARAHNVAPEKLAIIHMVEAHDKERDAEHLRIFKDHGIRHTRGAELISPVSNWVNRRENTYVVEATGLSDLTETALPRILDGLTTDGGNLSDKKVAVIGVWTELKVARLIQNLVEFYGAKDIATCSALDASRHLERHFTALSELEEYFGVRVTNTGNQLLQWMVPSFDQYQLPKRAINIEFKGPERDPEDLDLEQQKLELIQAVAEFGPEHKITLQPLGGGLSGCEIFIAEQNGERSIIKVGPSGELGRERAGNVRVAPVLRGFAPRMLAFEEMKDLAAMRQELVGDVEESMKAPRQFIELAIDSRGDPDMTAQLQHSLTKVLRSGMGRYYDLATQTTQDLFSVYELTDGFGAPKWNENILRDADKIAKQCGYPDVQSLLESVETKEPWMNPEEFYNEWLPGKVMNREIRTSLCHRDLNPRNILVGLPEDMDREAFRKAIQSADPSDERRSPSREWIIDFELVKEFPVLTDFSCVENDLAYFYPELQDEGEFFRFLRIQESRLKSDKLEFDVGHRLDTREEIQYVSLLQTVRSLAAHFDVRGKEAMEQYRIALLDKHSYLLGWSNTVALQQRRLALHGVAQLCYRIANS